MQPQYTIFNVSAEIIMDVAKQVASSPNALDKVAIANSFAKNSAYVGYAINQSIQLGLIMEDGNGAYIPSDKYRDMLYRCQKSQLLTILTKALQGYPPFLVYSDFVSKGYSSEDSARMSVGMFGIQSTFEIVEKMFRNWGQKSGLIILDSSGKVCIPEGEKGLPDQYIESLKKALKADFQAKIFLIETMTPSAFKYLTEHEGDIDSLADALVNYHDDPKTSVGKATQVFEHFLYHFGLDAGANVSKGNGIIQYAETIKSEKPTAMLVKHKHLCYGLGGLRLMSHHDPDKETNKSWYFTPQGAIITSLMVPSVIRSLHLYSSEGKQEF